MEEQDYHRRLIESTGGIPWEFDLSAGRFTRFGTGTRIILGYSPQEWREPGFWHSRLHEEDREWATALRKSEAEAGQNHESEYRLMASDGRTVWIRDEVAVTSNVPGKERLIGLMSDITNRKLMEHALQTMAQTPSALDDSAFFQTVVENAATVYGARYAFIGRLLEGGQRVGTLAVWAGDRIADNFEYELHGTPCADIMDRSKELIPRHAATTYPEDTLLADMGVESYYGAPLVATSGETLGILSVMDVRPLELNSATGPVLGVFAARVAAELQRVQEATRSESERATLAEELLQARKLESVGRLAGGVAHDFNNLLTVILGHTHESLARDPKNVMAAGLEEIQKAAERAQALTRQLLAFSRRQDLSPQRTDVNDLIGGLRETFLRLLGSPVRIELDLAESLPCVLADRVRLEQAILNLALNGRDAMPDGGVLKVQTQTTRRNDGKDEEPVQYVRIAVTDSGHGIASDARSQIFEPFFTTKPAGRGTGLGLASVYGLVRQSSGYIDVHSEQDVGTTFTIDLPAVLGEPEPAHPLTKGQSIAPEQTTVLVVEDEPMLLSLVVQILSRQKYGVIGVTTLDEAVATARDSAVDVLLTDISLAGPSGFDVARAVLEVRPEARVLYMSGYANAAGEANSTLDQDNLITKPFTPTELTNRIAELLAR